MHSLLCVFSSKFKSFWLSLLYLCPKSAHSTGLQMSVSFRHGMELSTYLWDSLAWCQGATMTWSFQSWCCSDLSEKVRDHWYSCCYKKCLHPQRIQGSYAGYVRWPANCMVCACTSIRQWIEQSWVTTSSHLQGRRLAARQQWFLHSWHSSHRFLWTKSNNQSR